MSVGSERERERKRERERERSSIRESTDGNLGYDHAKKDFPGTNALAYSFS